jgi:hypothetical protein
MKARSMPSAQPYYLGRCEVEIMSKKKRKIGFTLSGALVVLTVEVAIELVKNDKSVGVLDLLDKNVYPHLIVGLFIGGILGGMFHITREMQNALDLSIGQLDDVSKAIKFQKRALVMLLKSGHFGGLLERLIRDSIVSKFTHIAFVSPIEYLTYLIDAIQYSNSYHGIQRKPIYWFKENSAEVYLRTLRSKKMAEKVRIFLIDDAEVEMMLENLNESSIMDWYWENTGITVQTYWIACRDFDRHWPGLIHREDFALYDRTLLIKYDETRQVLSFDLVEDSRPESLIFNKLKEQVRAGIDVPFRKITPPAQTKGITSFLSRKPD